MLEDNPSLPNKEYLPHLGYQLRYLAYLEQNRMDRLTKNTNNILVSELEKINNLEAEESFKRLLLKKKRLN